MNTIIYHCHTSGSSHYERLKTAPDLKLRLTNERTDLTPSSTSPAATTVESPKLSPINNAAIVNSVCFTVCTLNIHSLLNSLNYTAVADLAVDHNIYLTAQTETWIKPTSTPAQLGDATPPGYSILFTVNPVQPLRTTTKLAFWGVD